VSAVRSRWADIALASAVLAGVFQVVGAHSPVRVAVILWFVLVCPGLAVVRLLRLSDPVAELSLAVAVSIALAVGVAGIGLYSGLWSPGATLAVLIAITIGAVAAPLAGRRPGARP
jgi:hypothetical protein